jgi:phage tail-like protein
MARFLGLMETIQRPIEWNIDNFDLFIDPGTCIYDFLPWLAGWFEIIFDPSWSEAQQRKLLKDAYRIYALRGTRWALSRVLEIYTGVPPRINDSGDEIKAFTFVVNIKVPKDEINPRLIEAIIDIHKPAHSSYKLEFS